MPGMRGPAVRLVLAAMLLVLALPALAATPQAWLSRMQDALRELDYVGTLIYSDRGRMETLKVFHRYRDGVEDERLLSLSGEAREILRRGGEVTCIGSRDAGRTYAPGEAPRLGAALAGASAALGGHYRMQLGPGERIAGRDAVQLDVLASDAFRYSYRLWLDRETALPLKTLRFGLDGRVVEQLMFAEVSIGTTPSDADLEPSLPHREMPVAGPADSGDAAAAARFRVLDLPPGFELADSRRGDGADDHLVFSDGLAHVSVYIAPIKADGSQDALPAGMSRGALSAYARVADGLRVYVVGDVPELTARRFADGVVAGDG